MFQRNERGHPSSSPISTVSTVGSDIQLADSLAPSIIAKDFTIVGNAYSKGQVQISGEFLGDIECASIVVGERAEITGNLIAREIIVCGKVSGTIKGERVTLEAKSLIEGDIYHQSLTIQEGAVFAGKSYRLETAKIETLKPAAKAAVAATAPVAASA